MVLAPGAHTPSTDKAEVGPAARAAQKLTANPVSGEYFWYNIIQERYPPCRFPKNKCWDHKYSAQQRIQCPANIR